MSEKFIRASVAIALTAALSTTAALGQAPSSPPPRDTTAAPRDTTAIPRDTAPVVRDTTKAPRDTTPTPAPQGLEERYRDGMVIWETPDDAKVPFLLKFNMNTQLRYLNTMDTELTNTDHLGNTYSVHARNDITVNRAMIILGGYVFDKRARYSFTVWTSAGASSIVVASNVGWQFNKHLMLMGGYTGVPGSRSLVNTFPFYTSTDRTMADNFFRPGFTQGLWGTGEIVKNLNYLAFVGNGLNTLSISASKIDTHLLLSGSLWWEPLGDYGPPGKSRWMYDDYYAQKKVRIRLGTAYTQSKEDRFSNLDQSAPENTSMYNSDGVLTFSTGAFAPGVTVDKAMYKMWATDFGLKYNGFSTNMQFYVRHLSDFEADGPMPLTSTLDRGAEISVAHFIVPKKYMLYARGSWAKGEFYDPYEYGAGLKWHPQPTERWWFNFEAFYVDRAPYSGAFSPYTNGMKGWVPMIQTVLAF